MITGAGLPVHRTAGVGVGARQDAADQDTRDEGCADVLRGGERMSSGTIDTAPGPIAAILDFPGATPGDRQRLSDALGPDRPQRRLQGCLYHWLKQYPDGFRVIEFWRRQDLFEQFWDAELRPLLRELGVSEPHVTIERLPPQVLDEAGDSAEPEW